MTFQNPSYLQPAQQTLETLLSSVAYEISKNINCVKIGVIQSFDAATQEATVAVAFTQVTSIAPDGSRTLAEYPLLLNVPVIFPSGGGFTLTFPIADGDECVVLFNTQIDNWLAQGAGQPPTVGRVHDLSDGIAIVGIRNNTRALSGVSTSTAQLRSDDGTTYVEVAAGGIVNVVAPTSITFTTPLATFTGNVVIDKTLNVDNTGSSSTPCNITGAIIATGDITGNSISLDSHVHSGVQTGGGDTGPPV